MATYAYQVLEVTGDLKILNPATGYQDLETYLDAQGLLGWEVAEIIYVSPHPYIILVLETP